MSGALSGSVAIFTDAAASFTARVWVEGKRTFRCTGTDDPATARRILRGWQNDLVLREHGIETRAMTSGAEQAQCRAGSQRL